MRQQREQTSAIQRSVAIAVAIVLLALCGGAPAQVINPKTAPPQRGDQPASQSQDAPDSSGAQAPDESGVLTSRNLHGRPDIPWCLQLDLTGFFDMTNQSPAPWKVRIAVREDSVGLTLAHLYIRPLTGDHVDQTARDLADKFYDELARDSTVDLSSVSRGEFKDLATVELTRREV